VAEVEVSVVDGVEVGVEREEAVRGDVGDAVVVVVVVVRE
jgi:hypothetical protein